MNHLSSLAAAAQTWTSAEVPSESQLSDAELIEGQRLLAEARRATDVRSARFAAEIARRSRPELGHDGLAQRLGARTPQELVQKVAGIGKREASTMVRVGVFLKTPAAPDSPAASSWELAVREATNSGRVSTDVADVISRALAGLDLYDALLLDAARELLAVAGSVGCRSGGGTTRDRCAIDWMPPGSSRAKGRCGKRASSASRFNRTA